MKSVSFVASPTRGSKTSASNDLSPLSVPGLIRRIASSTPDATAILTPGGPGISYRALHEQVEETVAALNRGGIGRGDRVATVLPNGPEMALTFLSVAAGATIAPLNPAYSAGELAFFLGDLAPKALLVGIDSGPGTPALEAAMELGIPVLRLMTAQGGKTGRFCFESAGEPLVEVDAPPSGGFATDEDVALVLHTSGTTSRPKLVPLSHRNLCASAANISRTLGLEPGDRCLNVMPLFHIHGLIAGLLAPLATGGSAICPPGFYAPDFYRWLEEFNPTWYTAVPTMHQAILARAGQHSDLIARHPLRFIRSSSAPLPPAVLTELEQTFRAPVIEAYGMTEAAHQMASNPLPPGTRKTGSVGQAAGPEIAIMDASGELLAEGSTGEVVIRGENVTAGYAGNPEATAAAFTRGWFRTGDQGYVDPEGYLFLTGRLKELINRGGEKIAPREVDEALLAHPAVAQALAFALPHVTLGEDVAAAVVLREGAAASELELREFVASRLARFKVPSSIRIVDEIPKGPTGKPQRIGLADKLGLTAPTNHARPAFVPPATEMERSLTGLWADVLELDPDSLGVDDGFLDNGGDSMTALRLAGRIEETLGVRVPLSRFFLAATIAEQSRLLADPERSGAWPSLVPIQIAGDRLPLFCVHGACGDVIFCVNLARELGPQQTVYGLQARGLDGVQAPQTRVEDMARTYIEEIRGVQPEGPYCLAGYSSGGTVVYEMAQQLLAAGQRVGLLAIFDQPAQGSAYPRTVWSLQYAVRFLDNIVRNIPYWLRSRAGTRLRDIPASLRLRWRLTLVRNTLARAVSGKGWRPSVGLERVSENEEENPELASRPDYRRRVAEAQLLAPLHYQPRPYPDQMLLFRARRQPLLSAHDPALGWSDLVRGGLTVMEVGGHHNYLFNSSNVETIAKHLTAHLAQV